MALSTITSASLAAGTGGKILQVKYTQFTGINQVTSSANTDTVVTDLTVDITPTATNSIIKSYFICYLRCRVMSRIKIRIRSVFC